MGVVLPRSATDKWGGTALHREHTRRERPVPLKAHGIPVAAQHAQRQREGQEERRGRQLERLREDDLERRTDVAQEHYGVLLDNDARRATADHESRLPLYGALRHVEAVIHQPLDLLEGLVRK